MAPQKAIWVLNWREGENEAEKLLAAKTKPHKCYGILYMYLKKTQVLTENIVPTRILQPPPPPPKKKKVQLPT